GVHLLHHNVGGLAEAARKDTGILEDRCSPFVVAITCSDTSSRLDHELVAPLVFADQVPGAADGLELSHHIFLRNMRGLEHWPLQAPCRPQRQQSACSVHYHRTSKIRIGCREATPLLMARGPKLPRPRPVGCVIDRPNSTRHASKHAWLSLMNRAGKWPGT